MAATSAIALLQPGTLVGGDFRVLGLLAQGGMGAIYTVEQLSTGKQRALKVMHPSLLADSGLHERFVQEARIGSMIPSDHVVEVVAAGIDAATRQPWLVMELLNGEDLAQHVSRRGPFALAELPSILRPIFHALAAAHARGIVHRDIKPENIYLATTMSSTQPITVKILDFGIAKVAAQALGTATTAMGSPIWMAPEQTESRSHVSPATDVWSLGLLVFWMLTARPYWRAAQGGSSVAQLMRELLFEPLEPASRRAAEYGLALPAGFDAWFARCVARDPSARFADATQAGTELLEGLLGATAGIPLGTAPSPSLPVPSVPPPQHLPSPMSATSAPIVTATAPVSRSSAGIGFAVLGGGAFIALGLISAAVIVAIVAFFVLRPDPVPVPAQTPAPPPPTQAPLAEPVVKTPPPPRSPVVVAPKKAPYSAGQKVDVLWGGNWWQGQIVSVKGDNKFLVHYIGWSSSYDEWVTTARLRPWTGSARTQ